MTYRWIAAALLVVFATSGCGLLFDLDPPDPQMVDGGARDAFGIDLALRDGGALDASPTDGPIDDAAISDDGALDGALPDPCRAAPIGAVCDDTMGGPALICLGEECVASVCGDGVIDRRTEQCDDANELGNDGCEPVTCELTCAGDMDCPSAPGSCLAASCAPTGCSFIAIRDGETCSAPGFAGRCDGGICRRFGCGDGMSDPGEACDDGNTVDGDGCDGDCTYSCTTNAECDDGDRCNGIERCSSNVCVTGEPLVCGAAPDACRISMCVPFDDCRTVPIDADGDGYSPDSLVGCGRDCDDGNPLVNPDSPEICSNGVDDNCSGVIDEGAALADWYADRDRDGYGDPRTVVRSCAPVPGHVLRGGDCFDAFTSTAAVVNPSQTAWFTSPYVDDSGTSRFDYDCSGSDETRFSGAASTCARLIGFFGCGGDGWDPREPECGGSASWQSCRGSTIFGFGYVCNRDLDSTRTQECH